ncbi:MAG: indole-3-glycerol phosphate synthase TrpC [Planctomycetota bacterium]|nr:indole-3-glycerol phosphate synthase TrpC [Planctomycetota bacterium]
MPTILDEIVEHKKLELEAARQRISLGELESDVRDMPPAADFLAPLREDSRVSLIAEVKKASPSKGLIRADFEPLQIAREYAENGASCISVLTDEKYFQGHLDFLGRISSQLDVPLLRKEFVIDPYQVFEARKHGASAVLLIAECLGDSQLQELHDLVVELEMTPLVEFHEISNLERSLATGASLIGVNNRDLKTFHTDLDHVIGLRKQIPSDRTVVAESGIFSWEDVQRISAAGIEAMLVGESLMRQDSVGDAVKKLLGRG